MQRKPDWVKKIIIWGACIVLSVILGIFWFLNTQQKISNFPKDKLTPFSEDIGNEVYQMGKIEIPEINLSTEDAEILNNLQNLENGASATATE